MDLGLQGRVAIVGGASRGLGRACALGLAQEGARVAISSRRAEPLQATAQEIRSATGVEVLAVPGDLSCLADIQNLIQRTVDHFGRLDIVISNSGGPPEGRAVDTSEDDWERAIQMALQFFIRMSREAVPHLKQQSWGRIINILASTVYQPIENLALSGATRAGVVAFTKSLSEEIGRDNILVNNVCPGSITSDRMVSNVQSRAERLGIPLEEALEERANEASLGRLGRPEELAHLVAFLASGKASYITGVTIRVDGGLVRSVW